jgi:hypothetical protein
MAAWVQNSFFEPEKCLGEYVQYCHTGRIIKTDRSPEIRPGMAVWRLSNDASGSYTRLANTRADYDTKQLELPLIQVVVQVPKFRKRRGRPVNDGSNQANYDITGEMSIFRGHPMLDWLHVGLCVAHRYGVHVAPGEYSLSIIDGQCGLHTLSPAEAAVFSIEGECPVSGGPVQHSDPTANCWESPPKTEGEGEECEWSEPEPELSDADSISGNDASSPYGADDSEPEPDFDD